MLCTRDVKREQGQSHERIALELALTAVFASIGNVKPSAILINKHRTSLNVINEVVGKDLYCWRVENGQKIKIGGNVLLYHFHVMKVWTENLLSRVPAIDKDNIWRELHFLMHCPQEQQFENNVKKLYKKFQHIPNVVDYMKK